MQQFCDLHTHSKFSDGKDTPTALVGAAVSKGLSAVALCDHNTVEGLPEFLAAAEGQPIEAVPGAEFSVDYQGTELHLLGLYLPTSCFSAMTARMEQVNQWKEESNLALIASLATVGYPLDYAAICAQTKGTVNRSHIADELLKRYHGFSSKAELFKTLLSPEEGHYREPKRLTVWEMLEMLRDVGAVPVLAHPFLNLTEEALIDFLPLARKRGLIGMECAYSLFDAAKTAKAMALADGYGLLPSGGSDYHGSAKPEIALGSGKGELAVPAAWAEALRLRSLC